MKGLLTDFGGVLTTNVFDAFRAFCEAEGLDPDDGSKRRFREQPEALAGLRPLERGDLTVEEFEPGFAAALGVADHRVGDTDSGLMSNADGPFGKHWISFTNRDATDLATVFEVSGAAVTGSYG